MLPFAATYTGNERPTCAARASRSAASKPPVPPRRAMLPSTNHARRLAGAEARPVSSGMAVRGIGCVPATDRQP